MTAPGWFDDPSGASGQRYWDGQAWTEHTAPAPAVTPVPVPGYTAPLPATAPEPPPLPAAGARKWYQRKGFIIPTAVLAALIAIGAIGSAVSPPNKKDASAQSSPSTTAASQQSSPAAASSAPKSSAASSTAAIEATTPATEAPPIVAAPVAPPVVAPAPVTTAASAPPAVVVAPTSAAPPSAAPPAAPSVTVYANCAALNVDYPHGVGRTGAVDHVSGSSAPVTNFTVNDAVYNANTGRDGDNDGVACEKH